MMEIPPKYFIALRRSGETLKKQNLKIFLIVNGPVWLIFFFALLVFLVGISGFSFHKNWINIMFGIILWQLMCAGVMLLIDYPRKYKIYERLIEKSKKYNNPKRLLQPVKQTICGIFLAWAVEIDIKKKLEISN